MSSLIEYADAERWLARQAPGTARAIVYDPPYSRNKPSRGRWDGAAGGGLRPVRVHSPHADWLLPGR